MIRLRRREFEHGANVLGLEVRKIGEDFSFANTRGEQVQHILDANTEPADARTTAALVGVDGDACKQIHEVEL